ncbi:ribokinase [Leifsonia sp. LS1]|uniref:ribokinase n=1 Tax=Leifsonia sp. LS1 TaxID=2828483 RepID=UPI001CFEE81E|nr:ribokinase [Leifsonia sp. LS1]GIT80619.1 ribokinase [Leifsonia sp. LS1]
MRLAVFGSANFDYLVSSPAPPAHGVSQLASAMVRRPGGQGMNQAIAAARLHDDVSFTGCVGDDDHGAALRGALVAEGLDATTVAVVDGIPTGTAFVLLTSGGHSITVDPGANLHLPAETIDDVFSSNDRPAIVLLQGELGPELFSRLVDASGTARIVANLAPIVPLDPSDFSRLDPVVVNRAEAASLIGAPVDTVGDGIRAAEALSSRARSAVVTLGADGAAWASAKRSAHVPPRRAGRVVDVSGAGDGFSGALAAGLARGHELADAVRFAVDAALLVVERQGVLDSLPYTAEIEALRAQTDTAP